MLTITFAQKGVLLVSCALVACVLVCGPQARDDGTWYAGVCQVGSPAPWQNRGGRQEAILRHSARNSRHHCECITLPLLRMPSRSFLLVSQVEPSKAGVTFTVSPAKRAKWAAEIDEAIESAHLDSGSSQKLAGRLMWATQMLFHRVGRAMIKPIYAQKVRTSSASRCLLPSIVLLCACQATNTGHVGRKLMDALRWWSRVLKESIAEKRLWQEPERQVCRLLVDAASTPARVAAVLLIDGVIWYTDIEPDPELMRQLQERGDKQITSLVSLSSGFGT